MKTKKHIRQTPRRPTRIARQAKRFPQKRAAYRPQPAAPSLAPRTAPTDFLALCLYPGMGGDVTAA